MGAASLDDLQAKFQLTLRPCSFPRTLAKRSVGCATVNTISFRPESCPSNGTHGAFRAWHRFRWWFAEHLDLRLLALPMRVTPLPMRTERICRSVDKLTAPLLDWPITTISCVGVVLVGLSQVGTAKPLWCILLCVSTVLIAYLCEALRNIRGVRPTRLSQSGSEKKPQRITNSKVNHRSALRCPGRRSGRWVIAHFRGSSEDTPCKLSQNASAVGTKRLRPKI